MSTRENIRLIARAPYRFNLMSKNMFIILSSKIVFI